MTQCVFQDINSKSIFTAGEAAKLCGVTLKTISKWTGTGELPSYRIGCGQHRRIPRDGLIYFLKAHGMPLNGLKDTSVSRLLIYSLESRVWALLASHLPGWEIIRVTEAFDMGLTVARDSLGAVVIDLAVGFDHGVLIGQMIRDCKPDLPVWALVPEDRTCCLPMGFTGAVQMPSDLAGVAEAIRVSLMEDPT